MDAIFSAFLSEITTSALGTTTTLPNWGSSHLCSLGSNTMLEQSQKHCPITNQQLQIALLQAWIYLVLNLFG